MEFSQTSDFEATMKGSRSKCFGSPWRSGWDSNPRAVARKLISSQPRYDHFDTAAWSDPLQDLMAD